MVSSGKGSPPGCKWLHSSCVLLWRWERKGFFPRTSSKCANPSRVSSPNTTLMGGTSPQNTELELAHFSSTHSSCSIFKMCCQKVNLICSIVQIFHNFIGFCFSICSMNFGETHIKVLNTGIQFLFCSVVFLPPACVLFSFYIPCQYTHSTKVYECLDFR